MPKKGHSVKYEIRKYGDPILRREADPIEQVDEELRQLARDMIQTMRDARGVGLAAQQIGLAVSICVVEVPADYDVDEEGASLNPAIQMPLVLINPSIIQCAERKDTREEGCLSFPGIDGPIQRPVDATVRYMDTDGEERECLLKGFVARVVQHEIDHLNGVLFIDRMSQVKRIDLSGRLKRMRKETQAALATR